MTHRPTNGPPPKPGEKIESRYPANVYRPTLQQTMDDFWLRKLSGRMTLLDEETIEGDDRPVARYLVRIQGVDPSAAGGVGRSGNDGDETDSGFFDGSQLSDDADGSEPSRNLRAVQAADDPLPKNTQPEQQDSQSSQPPTIATMISTLLQTPAGLAYATRHDHRTGVQHPCKTGAAEPSTEVNHEGSSSFRFQRPQGPA